ncbi:hypothetical protein B0H13DRAFT_2321940 [Mycena leptocephala]|nr:hypothetical protein B0H13DRAFT_2321940 [Mycena leptocephala]
MDKAVWERFKKQLGGGKPSRMKLRMASGQIVQSEATWEGGGGWEFLFGKPLQAAFGAVHDYKKDVVKIQAEGKHATLTNQGKGKKGEHEPAAKRAVFMGVLSFANTPMRGVHSKQRPTWESVNRQKTLDTIPEDGGEKREELAETTIVEAIADEDKNMANEQRSTRTNSPGACVTPVREVPVNAREGSEDDANNSIAECLEYEGSLSLWWARVRREQRAGTHEVTMGVIATPTRGVPTLIKETTRANHVEPKERQKETRRARVEEVEDEGDVPARLRTEVYMHPEIAWPQTRTSSLGVRATPVREVPYETSQRREDNADKTVAETHEERKEEMMGGEEEHTSCERGISMGVGAAPVRGVIPTHVIK